MAYQISIISGSKEQSLTLDAVMAAVAPPNDLGLVPGKTAGRILVKRAGGLETELIWSDSERLLYTTQPETDVVAAMIGLAAKLGGRVRGENFETYRTPSESYDHPDDKDFIARGREIGRRFRRRLAWKRAAGLFAPMACVAGAIFALNCPWFWPKPEVFAASPAAETSPVLAAARKGATAEVVFVPLDDFDFRFVADLGRQVSSATGLRVITAVPIHTKPLVPYPGSDQYDAMKIADSLEGETAALRADYGNAMVVFFTNRDINQGEALTRFVFSHHDYARRVSVVSSSRLVLGMGMAYANRETIRGRLFKFALRCVGEHHFALPRSGNRRSVMYTPIRGLPDVDMMGFELDPNPPINGSK